MSNHTPGPWMHVPSGGNHDYLVYPEATGRDVAIVRDFSEANARLIAAAPEMLEALKVVLIALGDEPHSDYPLCTDEDCAACMVEAAIAKATG